MTDARPTDESDSLERGFDTRVDLFSCRSCRNFTRAPLEGRGWCLRTDPPKLIEVRSYMKHCWQPRRR